MSTPDLDWTFGPAPAADEPPPKAAPRRPRPSPAAAQRLSRRTWLLLGAVAVLALALALALPRLEAARTRQAVEQVVARQETARLAGDWDTLSATFAPDPLGWAVTHEARLRLGRLPTPISLPGLRSAGQPGRVIRFEILGSQLARADVERGFVLANGALATFAIPQFYQFIPGSAGQPGGWRQAPPPDATLEPAEQVHGPRIELTYHASDADLPGLVIAELSVVLLHACLDWNCPPGLRVAVNFDASDPASAASPAPYDSLLGSLALQVILGRPSAYPAEGVALASRLTGGYPTNFYASEEMRRVVGVQALILVAQQLAPNTLLHGENAYLDAMIAREASRLGLDVPDVRELQIANSLYPPADLWRVPLLHATSEGALPQALVILNHVLAASYLADEQRLMRAFSTAPDAPGWLAAGLGRSRSEAQARLDQALDVPFPPVHWPAFAPDLALSCRAGPVLASLAGQTAPLLDGDFPDSSLDAWSPDGQRLALAVSGRRGFVAAGNPAGQFLPQSTFQTGQAAGWASRTVLVLPPVHLYQLRDALPPNDIGLDFFDAIRSGGPAGWASFDAYVPSPDGAWATLVGQPSGPDPALSIIPALGGPPISSAVFGYNPAWSADSQHLAFARRDETGSVDLVIFDLASREQRTILTRTSPGVPPLPVLPANDLTSLLPAWGPAGDRLAVASVTNLGDGFVGWVGLIAAGGAGPDGPGIKLLSAARNNMAPSGLAYSADGRYLAVSLFDNAGSQGVAVYADGTLVRWLPGYQAGPWSPTGHTLALTGLAGVSLLRTPDAAPQSIGPAGCTGLAWKP